MAKDHKAGTISGFSRWNRNWRRGGTCFGSPSRGRIVQLRDRTKNFTRRSQEFVETAKEQMQDAVDQGTDAYKQAKKAGA
jgi:hypothetical protein